ncbi:uncharacterized protein LOC121529860 [Drosophila eugracilis]|uniref:uncharacterized protein LOC121529860 n=1 Tax=Drosophila eugracilis TaxID=29029 RepID=UPI001BDA89D2|nr:uncharacterized protein LOC121529860 [Drosophila eugracilis]
MDCCHFGLKEEHPHGDTDRLVTTTQFQSIRHRDQRWNLETCHQTYGAPTRRFGPAVITPTSSSGTTLLLIYFFFLDCCHGLGTDHRHGDMEEITKHKSVYSAFLRLKLKPSSLAIHPI